MFLERVSVCLSVSVQADIVSLLGIRSLGGGPQEGGKLGNIKSQLPNFYNNT